MNRRTNAMVTTACIGMAVGTAAYMMTANKTVKNKSKRLRKSTGRALHQVGSFLDNVSYMIQ